MIVAVKRQFSGARDPLELDSNISSVSDLTSLESGKKINKIKTKKQLSSHLIVGVEQHPVD